MRHTERQKETEFTARRQFFCFLRSLDFYLMNLVSLFLNGCDMANEGTEEKTAIAAGTCKRTSNSCKSALSTQIDKWYRFWTACVCLARKKGQWKNSQSIDILDRICLQRNCLLAPISNFNGKDVLLFRAKTNYLLRSTDWKLIMKSVHFHSNASSASCDCTIV